MKRTTASKNKSCNVRTHFSKTVNSIIDENEFITVQSSTLLPFTYQTVYFLTSLNMLKLSTRLKNHTFLCLHSMTIMRKPCQGPNMFNALFNCFSRRFICYVLCSSFSCTRCHRYMLRQNFNSERTLRT